MIKITNEKAKHATPVTWPRNRQVAMEMNGLQRLFASKYDLLRKKDVSEEN